MEKEGKPLSNDDLISREALKKEFRKDVMGGLNWERIINNAPAIDNVINVYPNGEVIVQEKRPRGKWIDTNNVGANNWCSVCGEFILHYNGICNYCANCGADMREEGSDAVDQ